jgi:hypothetical protein
MKQLLQRNSRSECLGIKEYNMKLIKTIVLFALLTLFAGCNMFNEPDNANFGGGSGGGKIAQVDVTIGGNARTILPNVTFSKYTLSAESADDGYTGAVPSPVEITDGTWGTMSLPYGEWIITATAYVSVGGTDYSVAKGSAPLYVYEDSHNIEIVIIAPESGGTGTFTYKVTYPSGGSASVELRPIGDGALVVDEASVASVNAVNVNSVPSGVYFLTVKATASGKTVTRNEVVHIYDQSTTEADYVFTKLDFEPGILRIGGTIKLLVNGVQPANGHLITTYADRGGGITSINFTGTDGSGTWGCDFHTLNGANTLNFSTVALGEEIDILTIPVPVDDKTDIDLGTVNINFETTALTADSWTDGDFYGNSQNWINTFYSMNVIAGQTYYLWWNDSHEDEGDGTKTADISVYAYYSDLTDIFLNDHDSAWHEPASFTANATGTVYLRVQYFDHGNHPTYAIAYSTDSNWHSVYFEPSRTPVPLAADTWTDGSIYLSNDEDWYSINVTAGQTYYLWSNSNGLGDGSKTADISVSAYRSSGAYINRWYIAGYSLFTAISTGTVYLKVRAWGETGTYAIAYSDNYYWNFTPFEPPTPAIQLAENVWHDGNISASGAEDWYSINVTEGQSYYLWLNDRLNGDGAKTLAVIVEVIHQFGSYIYSIYSWESPHGFGVDYNGPVYLRVRAVNSDEIPGTYAIAYSDNHNRPEL